MAVDEAGILDFVGLGKTANTLIMEIADHLPWDRDSEEVHIDLLWDKMNTYLAYVEQKDYLRQYPKLKPDAFIIMIHFKEQPTVWCMEVLTKMHHQILEYRKARSENEEVLIIFYPPYNDAGPCKTGYVIEFYPEDDVNRLLDWEDLLPFDIRDYVEQEKQESNEQTLLN